MASPPPHDHRPQTPILRSLVFSSLVLASQPQKRIEELIRARDLFYKNHAVKKKEEANDFVQKITFEANKPEYGAGIACGLLTLRNQDFLVKLFDLIFPLVPTSSSKEWKEIQNSIWKEFTTMVRKFFLDFSPNPVQNALIIQKHLCETENYNLLKELTRLILSSIDTGTLSDFSYRIIKHFLVNIQSFPQIWQNLDTCIPILLLKLLRSYQDTLIISELFYSNKIPEPAKAVQSHVSINSVSSATTYDANSKALIPNYESLWSTNSIQQIVNLFQMGLINQTIEKCIFKDIVRILYDPRTNKKMYAKFTPIYQKITNLQDSSLGYLVSIYITQVMLPYPFLNELCHAVQRFEGMNRIGFPQFLRRQARFIDIDFILSDVFRCYLQSVDFDNIPLEKRASLIKAIIEVVMETGNPLTSALHSIIADFFYIKVDDFRADPEYQKKILLLVYPAISLIAINRNEKIATPLVEIMMSRLHQPDFNIYKRKSVRELFTFYRETKGINVPAAIMNLPSLSQPIKDDFDKFMNSEDTTSIPTEIVFFTKKKVSIESSEGVEAIHRANSQIQAQFEQSGNSWHATLPGTQQLFDMLIPQPRVGIETVMDILDIHVVTFCMSNSLYEAQKVMKYVAEHNLYIDFNDALSYVDLRFYGEALINEIKENRSAVSTKQFILKCVAFNSNSEVLYNICEYCSMSTIIEMADLHYIDLKLIGIIFATLPRWSNDAQAKMTHLISGSLITPGDLLSISDSIVNYFDQLPSSILLAIQNMMMLRTHQCYALVIEKLMKLQNPKAKQLCKIVSNKWISIQPPSKSGQSPSSLLPSTML